VIHASKPFTVQPTAWRVDAYGGLKSPDQSQTQPVNPSTRQMTRRRVAIGSTAPIWQTPQPSVYYVDPHQRWVGGSVEAVQ
jgi:hypothetical protein